MRKKCKNAKSQLQNFVTSARFYTHVKASYFRQLISTNCTLPSRITCSKSTMETAECVKSVQSKQ